MNQAAVRRMGKWELILVLLIYISVFINSYVFFKEPFEFYFGYVVFLVLLPVFIPRYGVNRNLFYVFSILVVAGIFNIFMGNNTAAQFLKVFTGLSLSYFFYYYVIVEYNYEVDRLFRWYLKGAYIVSFIGIFQFISYQLEFRPGYDYSWILNKWGVVRGGNFGIRVNSIFSEPTYLGTTLAPAFFVAIYNLFRKENFGLSKVQSIVVVACYLLSFSGLGQVGIFLTLFFLALNFGLVRYVLIAIPIGIWLFNYMHANVRDFRDRYDSLITLFTTGKFTLGQTHGSSFILYNNYMVALENFKSNFVFGTGIGSHSYAFEKYSLASDFKVWGFNLNSADANSMLLRLVSETGLFGVIIFLVIMIKCYVPRHENDESSHWIISNSILVMILLNLFRQGHYFLNGFPFFVLLYIFNYLSYTGQLSGEATSEEEKIQEPDLIGSQGSQQQN
jgi:hypothetical protein